MNKNKAYLSSEPSSKGCETVIEIAYRVYRADGTPDSITEQLGRSSKFRRSFIVML